MLKFKGITLMLILAFLWGGCEPEEIDPINPLSANAGDDQQSTITSNVILDGRASVNANNQPMQYAWEIIRKPETAWISINNPDQVISEFVGSSAGEYVVQLTVSYGNWQDTDSVKITLAENQEHQLEAKAGQDIIIETGNSVNLDASSSIAEAGQEVSYLWEILTSPEGNSSVIQNSDEVIATLQPDKPGEYLVKLTLRIGTQSSHDLIKITAITGNSTQGAVIIDSDITSDRILNNVFVSEPEKFDYLVTRDVAIRGAKLTIEPGVRIGFENGVGLLVAQDGSLKAYSPDHSNIPIIFQGKESEKGYWNGIDNLSQNPAEYISGIEIRDAGKLGYGLKVRNGAKLFLTNSHIHHNLGRGVLFEESALIQEFNGNFIYDNEISPIKIPAGLVSKLLYNNQFQNGPIEVTDGRIFDGTQNFWPNFNVDYHVLEDLIIYNGSTITLGQGVHLNMANDKAIRVTGGSVLSFVGSETDPIIIEGINKQAGTWRGIYVDNSQGKLSTIFRAEIRHAGSNPIVGGESATIKMGNQAKLSVQQTILDLGNGHGLEAVASNMQLIFNLNIIRNHTGHPMYVTADMVEHLDYLTLMENNGSNEVAVDGFTPLAKDDGEIVWNGFTQRNPYIMKGLGKDLLIQSGMRINHGVVIKMQAGSRIDVTNANGRLGYLVIEGLEGSPVIIKGAEETPGSWFGITYSTNNTQNIIQYAEIHHAGKLKTNDFSAAVTVDNVPQGSLLIQKSKIASSGQHGIAAAKQFENLLNTAELSFEGIAGEELFIWE